MSPQHSPEDVVEHITQADRDAALKVRRLQLGYAVRMPNPGHYLIQAFAAHRIAATKELRVALQAVVDWYGRRSGPDDELLPPDEQEQEIASAMRLLDKTLVDGEPS